jgi:hypothetical protein
MVGVKVGGDDPRQLASCERPGEQRLPSGAGTRVVDSGVDQREPSAVFDEVDVDVVEPERQGEPRPEDAGRQFDDLPGPGRLGEGEFERLRHR